VVVKLLEKLGKPDSDQVVVELCADDEAIVRMARDQWGCCVLKTCIDKADGNFRLDKLETERPTAESYRKQPKKVLPH